MIVFLYGRPGAGKTTIGRKLADLWQTVYIDCDELYTDVEKQQIIAGIITEEDSDNFLRRILRSFESYPQENIIIASQSLFRESQRSHMKDQLKDQLFLVCLDIPLEASISRLQKRDAGGVGQERELHFYRLEQYQRETHLFEDPVTYDLLIDNRGTVDEALILLSQGFSPIP